MFMFGATCLLLMDVPLVYAWTALSPSARRNQRRCVCALLISGDSVNCSLPFMHDLCLLPVCLHPLLARTEPASLHWLYTQITAQTLCSRGSTEQRGTFCLKREGTAQTRLTATVSPLADVQFISARDGEGGASRDSDGFDELDWTVWNRISL